MNYRLFQYPLPAPPELEDLNTFLRAQRVAAVTHHLAPTAGGTMLVFIVETVGDSSGRPNSPLPPKTDYRDQLSSAEFSIFSQLRDERKKWANAEGVPVYVVFTNEQLAEMVKRRVRSAAELGKIDGIGPARLEKYGVRLLALLAELPKEAVL
ncbi:MAG TPA: HRDC domain-containing protein [Verrucomicrobiae bacterium]|jgi:superfamily II DNA helicase RecQ